MPKKKPEPTFRAAVRRAVELCDGTVRGLAAATGHKVSRTQIRNLLLINDSIRTKYAIEFERATNGQVDRADFFPEIINGRPFLTRPPQGRPEARSGNSVRTSAGPRAGKKVARVAEARTIPG